MEMKINEKEGTFTLTGKLVDGKLSESGKSFLLASTRGTQDAGVTFKGNPVDFNVNITSPNTNYKKGGAAA